MITREGIDNLRGFRVLLVARDPSALRIPALETLATSIMLARTAQRTKVCCQALDTPRATLVRNQKDFFHKTRRFSEKPLAP